MCQQPPKRMKPTQTHSTTFYLQRHKSKFYDQFQTFRHNFCNKNCNSKTESEIYKYLHKYICIEKKNIYILWIASIYITIECCFVYQFTRSFIIIRLSEKYQTYVNTAEMFK